MTLTLFKNIETKPKGAYFVITLPFTFTFSGVSEVNVVWALTGTFFICFDIDLVKTEEFCYHFIIVCRMCGVSEVNIMWAGHQTHHSSEDYNLSTALRQSFIHRYTNWVTLQASCPHPCCIIRVEHSTSQ